MMLGARGRPPARRTIAGVPADPVTMDAAVERVAELLASGRGGRVFVTNANKAWLAARDPAFAAILHEGELVVGEYAMAWGAWVLGHDGFHNIGGIRLMTRLLAEAPGRGWSVYLLGAEAAVNRRLVDRVRQRHPGIRIAGAHHGYLDDAARDKVNAELQTLAPDLLFVGMGSPLQEELIQRWSPGARWGVAMGVGGSFDVLAGLKRDAPPWMRGRGLEWLFRLSQDPRRLWKRYLVTNPWFVGRLLQQRWRRRETADRAG